MDIGVDQQMKVKLYSHKLLSNLFPPESRGEIALRSIYHKVMASKIATDWQLWKSEKSYSKWKLEQDWLLTPYAAGTLSDPKVTFILQIGNSELNSELDTIRSIQRLLHPGWEIIVFSKYSGIQLPDTIVKEKRLTIINTPNYTELIELYKSVPGNFVLHCQAGDIFYASLLNNFYQTLQDSPAADLYYYDCDYHSGKETALQPFFKPTTLSPELIFSVNYLSRAIIRTERILKIATPINPEQTLGNQELDLTFRLIESGLTTCHIPKVLVTQKSFPENRGESAENIIASHLERTGRKNPECHSTNLGRRVSWKNGDPSISIIIPSKNNPGLIKNLVDSITQITDYSNYSITIVDNASDNQETLDYYNELAKTPNINVIHYQKPFNYSEAINLGARSTSSELLLFLNNDMKVIDPFWLQELSQWAAVPQIGVVGARLIRANHTIQHAGIILGMNGFMGHLYLNAPEHYNGLLGSADWYRNVYAVTGACQMVRRELFEKVGGYDEKYRLVFSDVDFCLRINQLGYRNLYTPFATLYHYEGKSRGYRSPVGDILRGYEQMGKWFMEEDPFFSPNLTYSPIPACQLGDNRINQRIANIEFRKKSLLKNDPGSEKERRR